MGYLVHLGSKENAASRRQASRDTERAPLTPSQRTGAGVLLAVVLAGTVTAGFQAAPLMRATLFPIASRDLPADADPGAVPTLADTGVYDRTCPAAWPWRAECPRRRRTIRPNVRSSAAPIARQAIRAPGSP